MSQHDELHELCALYALGAIEAADRDRLEAHLREGCPECMRELNACMDGALALAASAPAVAPDPALRERILQAVATETGPAGARAQREGSVTPAGEEPPVRRDPGAHGETEKRGVAGTDAAPGTRREPGVHREPGARAGKVVRIPLLAALGWAAALAFGLLGIVEQRTVRELRAQNRLLRDRQARLEMQLAEERRWVASLASAEARTALLVPTPAGKKDLSGWALYDPASRRAVLVLENLAPEPGHDFELWAIGSHGPRSLGVIEVGAGGRTLVQLPWIPEPAADVTAFAVSYEAKGGSPNPTSPAGPVVMLGSI